MKDNYTHICVVLDSSSSMQSILLDTIGGFNIFLKAQKEAEGEATMSLYQFASGSFPFTQNRGFLGGIHQNQENVALVDQRFAFSEIKNVPELNTINYTPGGYTPLLDAIGESIVRTGKALEALPEALKPAKVLFVIITDGEENASKVYNFEKIAQMTKHQTDVYKWEFMYLGANQDAIKVGASMGIQASKSASYGLSAGELTSSYGLIGAKTASFRMRGASADTLSFNAVDRAAMKVDDASTTAKVNP